MTIEIQGAPQALDGFEHALRVEAPPLARIDSVKTQSIKLLHEAGFQIIQSKVGAERRALVSPDMCICDECLRELFDPADRRYRYPFINCTNCGPRFTIIEDVPHDRVKTTMRVFPMCPACQGEYDDPLNRRFHAQPNVCPVCGPQVALVDDLGEPVDCTDPIIEAARQLTAGSVQRRWGQRKRHCCNRGVGLSCCSGSRLVAR